jgi:hypothetical protein
MSEWMTREDYIDHLSSKYDVARGEIVEAVDAALASNHVTRRGWLNDASRFGGMEYGEPVPEAGPYELPYAPIRPFWLERNKYERIEYSTHDLDRKTREGRKHWRTVQKKKPAPLLTVEDGLARLRPEAERRRSAGKGLMTGVRPSLRKLEFRDEVITVVINTLQHEGLVRTREQGRPTKTST